MIFDTHMHCQYSIDSKMSAEEAKAAALQRSKSRCLTAKPWHNYYRTLG